MVDAITFVAGERARLREQRRKRPDGAGRHGAVSSAQGGGGPRDDADVGDDEVSDDDLIVQAMTIKRR